jgi:hypothetical protein
MWNSEVALAEYNNVVKAFPSDRTDQPFSISIFAKGSAATSVDRGCLSIGVCGYCPKMTVAPITSAGCSSPLGPLGILFVLFLSGPVLSF